MTPSVGLVPVHGLHLSWLSPHIPKPFLTPGSFFRRVCPTQHRLSQSLRGGREDTGGDWYFHETRDGDGGKAGETQSGCWA